MNEKPNSTPDKINIKVSAEEKKLIEDLRIRKTGEEFLKQLRAMPYTKTNKSRSFVILPAVRFKDAPDSENNDSK